MEITKAMKRFPAYFSNIEIPCAATEQEIEVYRACRTGKIEKESFLNTYEENGCEVPLMCRADDPQVYCLSTYTKVKDVKRFVAIDSRFQPPFLLAKGYTTKEDGVSCKTKEWKKKTKNSHVDWWLYEGAEPWLSFEERKYEDEAISSPK